MADTWTPGAPPKDGRAHVATGWILWNDGERSESLPFVALVHYSNDNWNDEEGLTLAHSPDEEIRFDHWISRPS